MIDIYELTPTKRRQFVASFCQTLVDLPKTLWRPCVIAIDETHEFAGEGESHVSGDAVALLSSKGRKRGFCPLYATQRLSKLSKDVAAEAKVRFVGQTNLDVDQRRAADFLGFPKARWTDLRDLSPPGHEGGILRNRSRARVPRRRSIPRRQSANDASEGGRRAETEPPNPTKRSPRFLGN